MNKNAPQQDYMIKRLILHFNIDKTIVMRDTTNNPDYLVTILRLKINLD